MSRVAVIIPNHNHEQYLYSSIESIRNQTYHDRGFRVVNDYPRIGKGFRMNQVIPTVRAEWLTIQDADDYSCRNRLQVCSEYFDSYDVIYHDYYMLDGRERPRVIHCQKWDRELYKKKSYIAASTVLVRAEIAQKVQWVTNTYGQDWIWLNLIAEHTDRFKYIAEPLMFRRECSGFTRNLHFKSFKRFMLRRKIRRLTK